MTKEQKGVLQGLLLGIIISILLIIVGSVCNTFKLDNSNNIEIAFKGLLLPGIFLMIAIGRLAKYRFFSVEDINGSIQTNNSQKAKILQSLIQNTLEQFSLAVVAYTQHGQT